MVRHRARPALVAAFVAVLTLAPLAVAGPARADGPQQAQTITITSTPPTGLIYDRGSDLGDYVPTGTSTSGLPVQFSVESPDGACASLPGSLSDPNTPGTITIYVQRPGLCIVHADQPGDADYLPAEQVSQSFMVEKEDSYLAAAHASKGVLGLTPTTFRATLTMDQRMGPGFIGRGPLPGARVAFTVLGKQVCTAVTNAQGVATCSATLGYQVVTHTSSYTASFAGDDFTNPAIATGVLGL